MKALTILFALISSVVCVLTSHADAISGDLSAFSESPGTYTVSGASFSINLPAAFAVSSSDGDLATGALSLATASTVTISNSGPIDVPNFFEISESQTFDGVPATGTSQETAFRSSSPA